MPDVHRSAVVDDSHQSALPPTKRRNRIIDRRQDPSYLTDSLGSTVALTDGTGTVRRSYTYDPFGNPTVSGAPSNNRLQYTGLQ